MFAAWRATTCLPSNLNYLNLIKADRINLLKKKYDAYLEEDKKRKERNVYILEKLDKLRYCTAMVPVRHKPDVIEDSRQSALYVSKQTLESPAGLLTVNPRSFPVNLPEKIIDDSILLQEISKKYILIPKTRPKYGNDYIQDIIKPETDENTDWKSKYDILKQLKRQEKEDTESLPQTTHLLTKQSTGNKLINTNIAEKELNPNHETQLDYKQSFTPQLASLAKNKSYLEPQSKNFSEDTFLYEEELQQCPIETFNEKADIQKLDERMDSGVYKHISKEIDRYQKSKTDDLDHLEHYSVPHDNLVYNSPDIDTNLVDHNFTEFYPVANEDINITQEEPELPEVVDNTLPHYINEDINNLPLDNGSGSNLNLVDENPIPVINPNEFIEQKNNDLPIEYNNQEVEHIEYPIEIINAQDFTPRDDVNVRDEININPVHNELNKSEDNSNYNIDPVAIINDDNEISGNIFDPIVVTEETDIAADIETFNAENNQEYYNEAADNYAYNQEGEAENYNADYTATNENYSQEEYAAYYEGAQTEQPYATETNEPYATETNDELLQRYDQNYDQQYGGEYDQQTYQQQEYVQEYSEQNDEQNDYTGQQETPQEDIHYENQDITTPQYVEQQLDNEEGYVVEKQNENAEITGQEKTLDNIAQASNVAEQVKA